MLASSEAGIRKWKKTCPEWSAVSEICQDGAVDHKQSMSLLAMHFYAMEL